VSPKKARVIVEGARMIKKHMRKSQQHPQGAIVEREGTLHISNVMKVEQFDARAANMRLQLLCRHNREYFLNESPTLR